MKISIQKAKQILRFVITIDGLIKVFDADFCYKYKDEDIMLSSDLPNFMLNQDDDERFVVTTIQILIQSSDEVEEDIITQYMTDTLGISDDDFKVSWNWLGGCGWVEIFID